MKRFICSIGMTALLVGCGSSVNLDKDKVLVEDKSGINLTPNNGNNSGLGINNNHVTKVDLDPLKRPDAMSASLRMVYFDYDSFIVKTEFQSIIEAHARRIKANKGKIVLEGHTDERGGREYNLALGQKRAEAVRSAFRLLGVPDMQLEAVSFGKEKPAAPGADEAALAKNRRVEISDR